MIKFVTAAILALCALGCGESFESGPDPNAAIRETFWRETLKNEPPVGSTLADATDYFKLRALESSYSAASRTLNAIEHLPPASGGLSLVSASIAIECHFDNSELLTGCKSRTVYTGP